MPHADLIELAEFYKLKAEKQGSRSPGEQLRDFLEHGQQPIGGTT